MLGTAIKAFAASVAAGVLLVAGAAGAQQEPDAAALEELPALPAQTPAETQPSGTDAEIEFVPGEIVVETRSGQYETRPVDATSLRGVQAAAERVDAGDPSVKEASPNFEYALEFAPDDRYFEYQDWLRAIRAPGAWEESRGRGVRVGLVDAGWQLDHPDLLKEAAPGYDFVSEDPEAEGYGYHGTSVAGVAAADTNNKRGVAGAGFNAAFAMAKACTDVCRTEDTAPAIDWLVQSAGTSVINLSFGAIYPEGIVDPVLGDAIKRAQDAGVLVVASAGNAGSHTATHYPSCFEGVLGVGAVDGSGTTKAGFSNSGPCVDLVAPGERVLTTFDSSSPLLSARYAYVAGTSFSAPQVAAVAALTKAGNPDMGAEAISSRLQSEATDMGDPGRDDSYGHGLLNAKCSVSPNSDKC